MSKEEWKPVAPRAAEGSAWATPMSRSPTQESKQGSVPASSVNTPPSSLPPIKNNSKPEVRASSRIVAPLVPAVPSKKQYFEVMRYQELGYGNNRCVSDTQEKVMKDRLSKRDFSHTRHDPYFKDLTKPENEESLSYADHHRKEFWRTDVASVVNREEEQRRARQKALMAISANEEACRQHRATKIRVMRYNAYVDMNERMQKVGCRNNQSGAPHINIITRECLGDDGTPIHEDPIQQYRDNVSKCKAIQRKLLLREKTSGARNFNILNWTENPPGPELPVWPEKPPTPPAAPPAPPKPDLIINTSKGALSYARLFGPFGVFDSQ